MRLPFLPIIFFLMANGAIAHEAPAYRLPGDPDTMVRRGPETAPAALPEVEAVAGSSAVRVEELPPSATRPRPETQAIVTREIILPVRRVFYPDPRWRLRIEHEDGEWSGALVIGRPGWGWTVPHLAWPVAEPKGSGQARLPAGD